MTRDELLSALAGLRQARIGAHRAPHKPLLVLWLLGRFVTLGSTAVTYDEAEGPVSRLINDFGPAMTNPSQAMQRAAMPFVHLERTLWDLRDSVGRPIPPTDPDRGGWLRAQGAHGRMRPEVERLLADPGAVAAAAGLLLQQHFTPALEAPICDAVGLEVTSWAARAIFVPGQGVQRARRPGFVEDVLHACAYAYACAFCGFDGALGRHPVGVEAAHVRWHSQGGPDEVSNGLALCSLHHTLFDLGVLSLGPDLRIQVSRWYVARSTAGQAIDALHGSRVATPRPGHSAIDAQYVDWHQRQVFKRPAAHAA
ncbi:phosphorothioated DNA-binding restriction endonuclease [Streptomyces sp. NPDC047009]|uniref:phosphorothioated DNA-binding restriction endonuclease n=1 Tax=Streptomyces sp. NPDC047009 TaxID=3154496 RepID=UPI0033D323FB